MDEDRGTDFDDLAEAYERMATALPLREHVEAHTLFALLGDVSGRAVLDLGCGSGLYTRTLRELGAASVAGVDSSEGMLGFARRRAAAEGMDISYFAREADAPPAEGDPELDGRFDLVYSVYVLCYAPTRQALSGFCRTARRALRPEGAGSSSPRSTPTSPSSPATTRATASTSPPVRPPGTVRRPRR